jgi:hypothetical protein
MAARPGDRLEQEAAQFHRELLQLGAIEPPQVSRCQDGVKQVVHPNSVVSMRSANEEICQFAQAARPPAKPAHCFKRLCAQSQ